MGDVKLIPTHDSVEANCVLAINALEEASAVEIAVVFAPRNDRGIVWIVLSPHAGKAIQTNRKILDDLSTWLGTNGMPNNVTYSQPITEPEHPVLLQVLTLAQVRCMQCHMIQVEGDSRSKLMDACHIFFASRMMPFID